MLRESPKKLSNVIEVFDLAINTKVRFWRL